ncbi:MAG: DUF4142 domain-containing protein [Pseudonocardiaceae bacterium]
MRPPIPRFIRWTVVLAVIAALTIAVFQYWNTRQVAAGSAQSGWTQTAWGPLGPADRVMLVKVRQASLWEMPTSQMAQQQGSAPRVREIGKLISAEHMDLDAQDRDVAEKLGVQLPNQPSAQQQGWMTEIAGKSGSDFDRTYVQRLRAAHGQVLTFLAQVRAGTRNDLVRSFATTCTAFVSRHMDYLESTGLVDFSALPAPPVPAGSPPQTAAPTTGVPAAGASVAGQQQVSPVAQATATVGPSHYDAALVFIAALLVIGGLLWLLGTAGRRARQAPRRSGPRSQPQPQAQSESRTQVQPRFQPQPESQMQVQPQPQPQHQPQPRSYSQPQPQPQPRPRRAMHAPGDLTTRPRHAAERW